MPGTDSNRCTSMATRKSASNAAVCASSATRGVARRALRFSATASAMPSASGDAQRLNSSSHTSLSPIVTTISGRSTTAGMRHGPDGDRESGRRRAPATAARSACRSATAATSRSPRERDAASASAATRAEWAVHLGGGSARLAPDQRLGMAFEVVGEHAQAARGARELLHRVAQLDLARRRRRRRGWPRCSSACAPRNRARRARRRAST